MRAGRHARALPHLERAIASEQAPAIAFASLAIVRSASGRDADAVRAGREPLRRDPELARAANNLAWILATSSDPTLRDPDEAVRLAETAVGREEEPDADLLDTLAAAYASASRFDEASAVALRAARRLRPGASHQRRTVRPSVRLSSIRSSSAGSSA